MFNNGKDLRQRPTRSLTFPTNRLHLFDRM